MIDKIIAYQPVFELNAKFEYSNSNYYLLGCILENLTKKTFAENLNIRIINKLNLKNTSFPNQVEPAKNEAFSLFMTELIGQKYQNGAIL